ncbi:MAG: hypothetical protein OJF49_003747 [Ktedonobacterales bacterium]|jgi:hypothetical protein|nr:MAG: hypothetical protein OJF49_003747 [Ktedonobacterales bacterium]
MSRASALLRLVLVALVVTTGFTMLTSKSAFAYSCDGYFCHYHMWANSGSGANGTRGYITAPTSISGISSQNEDTLTLSTWMWGSAGTGYQSSVEAGLAYGYASYCGTYVAYWHPYGTKDNGGTGQEACGTHLYGGTSYLTSAYHSGSNAHSRVQDGSTIVFDYNWGSYSDIFGFDNMSQYEVWATQGQSVPSWGSSSIGGLQWEDSNGNWNYWGFLNTSTDNQNGCPYTSLKLSSIAFQGYKSSGC